MKQLDDEKREKSKKIIDAIGGLQDDMISKANPENWEQGVYIGEKSGENNSNDSYEDKNKVVLFGEWLLKRRKAVAFVATLFVCVIVSGVRKLNSMDSKIEEKANDGDNYVTEQTAEPESTYYVWDGKKKKHPKKKKTGKHKKTVKKGNRKNITTNKKHPGKKDVVPDQDEEPAPTMKSYSEDNDTDRKRMGDGADDNAQSDNEQNSTAPEQTQQPDSKSDKPDKTDTTESVIVYKNDSDGNRTAISISGPESKKIENLIDGKKFSSDSDTEGYDAVIKYNGNEYYYVSKTKMLITSGKGAKLSDSENAEVKKILKID